MALKRLKVYAVFDGDVQIQNRERAQQVLRTSRALSEILGCPVEVFTDSPKGVKHLWTSDSNHPAPLI